MIQRVAFVFAAVLCRPCGHGRGRDCVGRRRARSLDQAFRWAAGECATCLTTPSQTQPTFKQMLSAGRGVCGSGWKWVGAVPGGLVLLASARGCPRAQGVVSSCALRLLSFWSLLGPCVGYRTLERGELRVALGVPSRFGHELVAVF